ncbi:GGDEF domain-containing protein [Pseudomonas sp. RIT-PI-S]|uniref:GGDEF domain-containing protein n=1 Tax=Pseudomonas sp. RIT-PI-S TaxID=3035295 RepID=UPI0021DB29FB|nr:GGDEF domain-containing protein [Pseudomonas sp. RIT-PI-S]
MPATQNPVRQKFFALLGFSALTWAGMAVAVGYGWARADALGPSARYWLHGGAAVCMLLLLGLVYLFLTLRRALMQRSEQLNRYAFEAEHDPLTGLINRRGFNLHLELAVAHARREQRPLTLLYLDLDGFKAINDQHGHATGDRLLRMLGERWQDTVRDDEALARLGGDEFALLAYGGGEGVEVLAQRLIDLAQGTVLEDLPDARIGVSIGMAEFPRHGEDRRALTHAADGAMYMAKNAGKQCFRWAE